ncbi:MAG TPA: hypothetical protein VGN30_16250 [Steroidobacteraceae bacterium]|jgi:uncharacterized lipoprotein
MSLDRVLSIVAAAALMSGCHLFGKLTPDCHTRQEYQRAGQVPPLKVPTGLDKPNTQGALVIPTVELAPPPPGPKDACLDVPPRYQPAPPNKAASEMHTVPPPPPPVPPAAQPSSSAPP